MASGTITLSKSTSSAGEGKIEWSSSITSVASLTFSVTATLYFRKYEGSSAATGTVSGSFSVAGTSKSVSRYGSWAVGTWYNMGSVTVTGIKGSNGVAKYVDIDCSIKNTGTTLAATYSCDKSVNIGTINWTMPTAPTSVSTSAGTVAQTSTSFTISWSGAKNGTFNVAKYRLYYKNGSSYTYVKEIDTTDGATSGSASVTLSGINSTRGNSTVFYVRAIDTKGNYSGYSSDNASVTLAKLPTAPTTINVSDGTVAQTTTSVTLSWSGASAGSGSISKYRIYYSVGSGWVQIKDVTGTSTTVTLSGIVSTRGSWASFYVATINSYSLVSTLPSSTSAGKYVYLAKLPTIPTTVTVSNWTPKRHDTITISWSGATAGSGSISNYYVDARRYKNGSWSDWVNISSPTSTNYSWTMLSTYTDLAPNELLQVRIGVRNSYSLTAGTHNNPGTITIKGGVIRINVNGAWKEGIAYINVNGVWKEASSVYTNVNGVWKESI